MIQLKVDIKWTLDSPKPCSQIKEGREKHNLIPSFQKSWERKQNSKSPSIKRPSFLGTTVISIDILGKRSCNKEICYMYIKILACRTTDFWLVDVLLSLDYYQVAIRFHTCTLDYQSKVTLYGIRRIDKTFENSCNVGKARNLEMLSHWFNVQCRKNSEDKSFISKSNFLLCQKPLDWVYYHKMF